MRWYGLIGMLALTVGGASCGSESRREEGNKPSAAARAASVTKNVVDTRAGRATGRRASGRGGLKPDRADPAQSLAEGVVPDGPAFRITGERRKGSVEVRVTLEKAHGTGGHGGRASIVTVSDAPTNAATVRLMTGCAGAREYVVAYAVLGVATDRVIARGSGRVSVLRHVQLPAGFSPHRDLAYAALPWVPAEAAVYTATGRIVVREDYGGIPNESCPGGRGGTVGAIG